MSVFQIARWFRTGAAMALWVGGAAWAQVVDVHVHVRALPTHVIVPQARAFIIDRSTPPRQQIEIVKVTVGVVILEQAATTTMDIELRNPSAVRTEAELLVPVPEGAAVRGFTFSGAAKEPVAELLPKDEAMALYKSIVARMRDPAILEFAGYNLIRSSVFPVEPHAAQKIRLTYEHLLPADGQRIDYLLPRTESIDYQVPWEVSVKIKSKRPISTVFSPSHQIDFQRTGKHEATVKINREAMREPGPVQLSFLQDAAGGVTASLFAYPDAKSEGGYFLLLAGLPAAAPENEEAKAHVRREVTVVLDRSGSMSGEKLKQAKAAALQVLDGLEDGEAFNVIDYSDYLGSFAPAPVIKDKKNMEKARHYVQRLSAGGGTNLLDALAEALRPEPAAGMLPLVLFLTDGQPTVGVRDEVALRNAAAKANVHRRRIFTFGVGYDVNAPLLTHLARTSRAVSTFVLPNEEIEAKVSQVFRRLSGPVLSDPKLKSSGAKVADLLPAVMPDLFEGDQLVVLGKYAGGGPLRFRLTGDYRGRPKRFDFSFPLEQATVRNSFVPRLWASRKIAQLIDEIRQAGAEAGSSPSVIASSTRIDPARKELIDEIMRLSFEFGILTEYTAFLAREGTDLSLGDRILEEAGRNLADRAQNTRTSIGAVNQEMNLNFQQAQTSQNRRNEFYDRNMNRVQISRVQQVNDRAFFQQGARWIDGSAINSQAGLKPDDVVTVGSPEFMKLLDRLVAENRQGVLAVSGETLIRVDGRNILIKGN